MSGYLPPCQPSCPRGIDRFVDVRFLLIAESDVSVTEDLHFDLRFHNFHPRIHGTMRAKHVVAACAIAGSTITPILATDSSRPRGVGPECMFCLWRSSSDVLGSQNRSREILQSRRHLRMHQQPQYQDFRLERQ